MQGVPESDDRIPKKGTGSRTGLSRNAVVKALSVAGGVRVVAARALGVSRRTLVYYIKEHPDLLDEIRGIEEETLDVAEAQVLAKIRSGDGVTLRWYLDRKGHARGYGRVRVEMTGKDGRDLFENDVQAMESALRQLSDSEREAVGKFLDKLNESGADHT